MDFRNLMVVTHRWIGLASSVVLAIVGATGAVLLIPGRTLFRRAAALLHQELALGRVGWWIVVLATIAAVLLQLGGLYLWWKKKTVRVRLSGSWRRMITDLHYSTGFLIFVLMFVLAVTGVGMAFVAPKDNPELRRVIFNWHTTRGFPLPVKLLYAVGTLGFMVQGLTGIAMWWKPNVAAQARSSPAGERE